MILIYLDDILLASSDLHKLQQTTVGLANELIKNDFLLNNPKCILNPVYEVDWLGKHISSCDGNLTISTATEDVVDAGALTIWCCAKYWSWPVLRQLNGLLTWLSIHHRLALPFLNLSHRFIHSSQRIPDHNLRLALCEALSHVAKASHRPLFYWHSEIPRFNPWVFWDANAAEGYAGILVTHLGHECLQFSVPLPTFIKQLGSNGQQLAELYAFKIAYVKSILLGFSSVFMVGDSLSSIFSILKLSSPAFAIERSKVLRQIARLAGKHQLACQLAFIPSELNPSDPLTKPNLPSISSPIALAMLARAMPMVMALTPDSWPTHKSFLYEMGLLS